MKEDCEAGNFFLITMTPTMNGEGDPRGTLEMVKIESEENGGVVTEKEAPVSRIISAAKSGNDHLLRQYLEGGEDIWEGDELGRTALHHAAGFANGIQAYRCVKTLLEFVGDSVERKRFVTSLDRQQRFPLFWATAKGNVDAVGVLLDNGADPTSTDKNLESALHAAAANSRDRERLVLQCVKRILQSEVCQDDETRIQLVNQRSSEDNRTVLHLSVVAGNVELVEYLLLNGADPLILDNCNYNILHLAIQNGVLEKAVALTELILKTVSTSHPSKLENLIGQIDNWNRAPVHLAARLGNSAIISYLVEANVNLFQIDQNLNTALHLAASLGNEAKASDCVSTLLNNGLTEEKNIELVNFSNNKGETALYLAAKNLNTEATKKLLLAGSEFDKRTLRNKSPLEKVYRNVPEALVVLLDEAVERSGYSARNGMISNYAKIDFGPILGKSADPSKLYRETGELAKICHARISQRQPVLNHTFVKIFVWKKWEKVWWCFALSRFLHILWYFGCLVYLMKVYREICPFKSPKNNTVQFSFSAISPPEDDEGDAPPMRNLNECDLSGFPKYGGIFLILGSIFVLLAELHPTYQRYQWYYKPLQSWTATTLRKNIKQILSFLYNVLPISQFLIFLLVALTSPPLFGQFLFPDVFHFTLVAAFAFTTCFCCYLEVGRIPSCRVYVNLLKKISSSLFFAILVHIPILVGFAAVFVFLLQDMPSFSSLPQAIVKVLTLSIGELDYQNVIYEGRLLFKGIEMLAFGIFVIFITVVLINFLVGLATDDVKESRNRRKEIWKMCTQIEQIMLLESFLDACGSYFGRYILKEYLMLMPPYRPGEQRRQVEIFIPSLPKQMQKELHNLNLKMICQSD